MTSWREAITGLNLELGTLPSFWQNIRRMMKKCVFSLGPFMGLVLVLLMGCSKNDPQKSEPGPKTNELGTEVTKTATQDSLVAKFHWLGKKQLFAESNATNFVAIWKLPESAKLEAQTLDKLSTAPWRLLQAATPLSNAPVALLRPLLDDLVQAESYLEVRGATNQPAELVFAIRLDPDRAALWQTNLPLVLKSLIPSATSQTRDTQLQSPDLILDLQYSTINVQFARSGDWTLLALSDSRIGNQDARLLADFGDRIQRSGIPFPTRTTNYWVEAQGDAKRFGKLFKLDWSLPENFPYLSMAAIGEGSRIRTRASLDFPNLAPVEMEAWNVPTNLIHDPLIGFMAIRGFRPLLKSLTRWDDARLGNPPNQAYFWSQNGAPLHFFAVPSQGASNQFRLLSEFLIQKVNPMMVSNPKLNDLKYGNFERAADLSVRWRGIPFVSPNLALWGDSNNPVIFGGLFPNRLTNRPIPAVLMEQLRAETNLLAYDWEISGTNELGLIQMTQISRFIFGRDRLSMTNNAALPWLTALSTNLGESGTSLRLVSAKQITFSRISSLGVTGAELHLLADWLESPRFPKGFFSLRTQQEGTNASNSALREVP